MEEVKYFQETERALREAVERLESAEERHEMLVRVNRQLGRRVGAFDDGVYMGIVRILSKLLVKKMEHEKIENYVTELLEISGIGHEDKEQPLRLTLYHMLMCVKLYEGLDEATRGLVAKWRKHFQYLIAIKFHLKETKRRKERKASPSDTPIEKKEKKDKKEKTYISVCDAKEAFRKECLSYMGQYDTQLLTNFYNYFSEANPRTRKMRWQGKRYWDTKKRLDRWVRNPISTDSVAASERLKKSRKKQQQDAEAVEKIQELAIEREEANARREAEIEQSKAGAVSYEEWLAKD